MANKTKEEAAPKPLKLKQYNKKGFLVPGSMFSMAAYHAKIYPAPRSEYQLRISDCNNAIRLWGRLETPGDFAEAFRKLETLQKAVCALQAELSFQYNQNFVKR